MTIKNIVKQNNMSRVKILVIIALYAMIMMPLQAQEWQTVSKFEFEMWGGLGVPLGGYHRGDSKTGASVGMSLRYNFSEIPVDCGVYVALNSARRDFIAEMEIITKTTAQAVSVLKEIITSARVSR